MKNKNPRNKVTGVLKSAHERNRTFTPLRMADFESAASTNSATWAFTQKLISPIADFESAAFTNLPAGRKVPPHGPLF
jgi:NAD-dependent DNA ligase